VNSITRALPEDIIKKVFKKLPSSYRFIAPVCREFRDLYGDTVGREKRKNKTYKYSICSENALEVYLDEAKLHFGRDEAASYVAAGAGRIDWVTRWGVWDEGYVCAAAARSGQIHVLKWMRGRGLEFDWNCYSCDAAARGGHLMVLQWLRERGSPWDWTTSNAAIEGRHLELLRWAIKNGCPYDEDDFREITDPSFHQWFESHKTQGSSFVGGR